MNGHHLLLDGIFYSYQFIPIDQAWLPFGNENLLEFVIKSFGAMFTIAFQMAYPLWGVYF